MDEKWRLFIAIVLPPVVVAALRETQERLKQQVPARTVRWTAPEGIHLTLKFLGDVPVARRQALESALSQAVRGLEAFDLTAKGFGCFPSIRRPRVVWIGVHENGSTLQTLRDAVEEHVAPLGYPTEDRPFNPHLTLGRVRQEAARGDVEALGAVIAAFPPSTVCQWRVSGLSLMRSDLRPAGPVYTELHLAPLGSARPE